MRIMLVYTSLPATVIKQQCWESIWRGHDRSAARRARLYSLQAYRNVARHQGPRRRKETSRTDTEQVRRMATFMESNGPTTRPPTARHTLSTLYQRGRYLRAETFARVTPTCVPWPI